MFYIILIIINQTLSITFLTIINNNNAPPAYIKIVFKSKSNPKLYKGFLTISVIPPAALPNVLVTALLSTTDVIVLIGSLNACDVVEGGPTILGSGTDPNVIGFGTGIPWTYVTFPAAFAIDG